MLAAARRHRVEDEDIQHGLRNALLVEEIGEDPTRYLVLGPDRTGDLLELVVLDRPHGPAVPCDAHARQVPATLAARTVRMNMNHGKKANGTPITDEVVGAMRCTHNVPTPASQAGPTGRRRGAKPQVRSGGAGRTRTCDRGIMSPLL